MQMGVNISNMDNIPLLITIILDPGPILFFAFCPLCPDAFEWAPPNKYHIKIERV
jgi:hypothetical protein